MGGCGTTYGEHLRNFLHGIAKEDGTPDILWKKGNGYYLKTIRVFNLLLPKTEQLCCFSFADIS